MEKWLDQYKTGGAINSLNRKVTCSNCGWSWKLSDGGKDPMTCHKCGGDIKMQEGGQLDKYQSRGEVNFTPNTRAGFVSDKGNFSNVQFTPEDSRALTASREAVRLENENQLKQEKAAKASKEKGATFNLPNGQSKTYNQMSFAEKRYVDGQVLRNKGRWNENSVEQPLLNHLNPLTMIYDMAAGLGEAPLISDVTKSSSPYVSAIANPLLAGRMMGSGSINPLGKKFWTNEISNPAFLNNMFFGVPSMTKGLAKGAVTLGDRAFSDVGRNLARIEKEGLKNGMTPYEIAKQQLQEVGITSNQRKAYVPGMSDFFEKYVFPYGYEGMGGNQSKLTQTLKNVFGIDKSLSKYSSEKILSGNRNSAREDAWSLYLGKPQKNNTFRMAETAPINHPAYSKNVLKDMDIYSLNFEKKLIPKSTTKNTYILNKKADALFNDISYNRDPNVMGGYNQRLSNKGLQYNDIWDLEPTIRIPLINKNIKIAVDDFIGKPFMSHGNIPFTWDTYQNNLINLLEKEIKNKKAKALTTGFNPVIEINNMSNLLEKIRNAKPIERNGGPIVTPRGQWDYPGQTTIIPSNQITMQGVNYPVLGVDNTGHQIMMQPGGNYTFPGQYVTEYPMMQGGGEEHNYWRTGQPMINDPSMDVISKVLLQRNQDKNFMQRAAGFGYQGEIPTKYIDGQDPYSNEMSNLLMGSGDNQVFPTIIQTASSQLSYQPNQTQEYITAPSWDVADYFAKKGYKRAANDMYKMKYQNGGKKFAIGGQSTLNPTVVKDKRNWLEFLKD